MPKVAFFFAVPTPVALAAVLAGVSAFTSSHAHAQQLSLTQKSVAPSPTAAASGISSQPISAIKPELEILKRSAKLLGLSTDSDGRVDRLQLEGGLTVEIAPSSELPPSLIKPGETLTVSGVGRAFTSSAAWPLSLWIQAMEIQNAQGVALLRPRAPDAERWAIQDNRIRDVLRTPRGGIDGLMLQNRAVIRWSEPLDANIVALLKPGFRLRAAGPEIRGQLFPEVLIVENPGATSGSRILLAEKSRSKPEPESVPTRLPVAEPTRELGRISQILIAPGGRTEGLILSDGTRVQIAPEREKDTPTDLSIGETVRIEGCATGRAPRRAIRAAEIQHTKVGAG